MRLTKLLLLGVGLAATSGVAHAGTVTVGFTTVSNNNATNVGIGQSQLKMTVSAMGADVNFHFFHMGNSAAVMANIYFDDRTPRLGTATLTPSTGVAFAANGSPPNLPAGNNAVPAFVSTKRFTANNPRPTHGISPGESLDIKFTLLTGDFDALIAAMTSGALRVGMHVQAFANDGSESFINAQPPQDPVIIPLPTAANLAFAGMGLLAVGRRRRIN